MTSGFVVWRSGAMKNGTCKLTDLEGIEDSYELDEGISRSAGWPEGALARMDGEFPKDKGLADSLYGAGFLFVSGKTKGVLEREKVHRVELLPAQVLDHQGNVASADYFVVNPLDVCDCIDVEKSVADWNAISPDTMCGCESLVLREAAIPPELTIFRPSAWKNIVIIRRALADAMIAAELTGLKLIEPEKYTGLV